MSADVGQQNRTIQSLTMLKYFLSFVIIQIYLSVAQSGCMFPAPAPGFTHTSYSGVWYEIGKIQTAGGAFFEKDCVCTQLGITITNNANGDGLAENDCRDKTVTGDWKNATGKLYGENPAGHWLETFGGPAVNYTVIAIGEDYAVEYDCTENSRGVVNYCVHVMSRGRTMNQTLFDSLIKQAEELGLNSQALPVQMTLQKECV